MKTIIVRSGDTLTSLAQEHLGNWRLWVELWNTNHAVIVDEQRRYPEARRNMQGPDWIFPGTVLQLPRI